MGKTRTFSNLRVSPAVIAHRIQNRAIEKGYEIATSADDAKKSWFLIQARKFSKVRTLTGNRRSIDIAIRGNKKQCKITIGTGQWGKNTIMSALPMTVLPVLGLANFVGSGVSSKLQEKNLWAFIDEVATRP